MDPDCSKFVLESGSSIEFVKLVELIPESLEGLVILPVIVLFISTKIVFCFKTKRLEEIIWNAGRSK